MINNIQINNFKCFKKVRVGFNLINVFIGQNGSGKSSIAQALMVLKQSLDRKWTDGLKLHEPLNLGKFEDVLYFKPDVPKITIGLSGGKVFKEYRPPGPSVAFSYIAMFDSTKLTSQTVSFQIEDLDITLRDLPKSLRIEADCDYMKTSSVSPQRINIRGIGGIKLGCGEQVGQPARTTGGAGDIAEYEPVLKEILMSVRNAIKNIYYVPGLRGADKPMYGFYDKLVEDLILAHGLSADSTKLVTAQGQYPEKENEISDILQNTVGARVQYRTIPGPSQTIDILKHSWKTNIVNDGLGLNQMLFCLAQMLIAPMDSLIIIEEPELHLHPRAQARFVDELVKIAKRDEKQLLLITHSEHILFRALTLIAKRELSPKQLSIYSFSLNKVGAKAEGLEITEDGRLKGALPGFFEHEIEELKEFIEASSESD